MIRYITLLLFIGLVFWGCENEEEISPMVFTLDPDGGTTPFTTDENGYLHMTIDTTRWQTIKTIYAHITRNGNPMNVINVGWSSSHYYLLNDTIGYIVDVGLNDQFQYIYYDTTYITGFNGFEVPCVNGASYTREDGTVNTVIAPVNIMRGDTMVIYWGMYDNWRDEETYGEFPIILD